MSEARSTPGGIGKKDFPDLFSLDIGSVDGNLYHMPRTCIRDLKQRELETHCRSNAIPLTPQRRVIMDELARRDDHPTPDDLYRGVAERIPGISRTTVYRVLDTLEQCGLITRVVTSEAVARFDADTTFHLHGLCVVCRRVLDLPPSPIDGIRFEPGAMSGFTPTKISIVVSGTCAACAGTGRPPLPEGSISQEEGENR